MIVELLRTKVNFRENLILPITTASSSRIIPPKFVPKGLLGGRMSFCRGSMMLHVHFNFIGKIYMKK